MQGNLKAVLKRNCAAALRRGDLAGAEAVLRRLQAEDALSVETRGLELEWLLRGGRLDEAAALATQLVELFPSSARVRYLAGWLAYRQKRYGEAVGEFEESERLHAHWHTQRMRGKALTQAGRLDEAEGVLVPLAAEHRQVDLDLAWLYERRADSERALRHVERYLAIDPENEFAQAQHRRLQALAMAPEELLGELETLRELNEEIPEELLPQFVEALIKQGRTPEVRRFLETNRERLTPGPCTRIGWTCYRLQAHDLALDLFLRAFRENRGNFKFLAALERAADRCGRVSELLELYAEHAPEERRLYGRIRTLQSRR
jgi:tetratricopeptide (TPR) repeat protein